MEPADSSGQRAVRADNCCGGEVDDTPFEQRVDLGRRRRLLLRRVALAGSVVLALAALMLSVFGGPGVSVLADRLAWAGSVWTAGLVLGWVRAAITSRRPDWRLPVALAAVVCGIVWQPLVPALVAVALLTERVARPSRTDTTTAGNPASSRLSPVTGQLG